ncbi:hypothetical protein AB0M44_48835 [Streptosporangium subroseum]|uniref:hypothetical protein n=1 Tax=Streptosporangium subroseum TaxID=106412 RepID=UPI00342606DA
MDTQQVIDYLNKLGNELEPIIMTAIGCGSPYSFLEVRHSGKARTALCWRAGTVRCRGASHRGWWLAPLLSSFSEMRTMDSAHHGLHPDNRISSIATDISIAW